jgi:hypothetical protein
VTGVNCPADKVAGIVPNVIQESAADTESIVIVPPPTFCRLSAWESVCAVEPVEENDRRVVPSDSCGDGELTTSDTGIVLVLPKHGPEVVQVKGTVV